MLKILRMQKKSYGGTASNNVGDDTKKYKKEIIMKNYSLIFLIVLILFGWEKNLSQKYQGKIKAKQYNL